MKFHASQPELIECKKDIDRLLNRVQKHNDHHALRDLINYFYPRLYRLAYSVVGLKILADEAINDVFLRLWQMRDRMGDIKNIDSYLFTATKNNALVILKKEDKWKYLSSIEDIREDKNEIIDLVCPENQYLTQELKERIDEAVANLPERCKNVFQLVKLEGLSYKAAALELSIEPKTVENQLAIALKKIIKALEPYLHEKEKDYVAIISLMFLLSPALV